MESMRVKVDNIYLNECIQKIALDYGYSWKGTNITGANYLYFNMSQRGRITWSNDIPISKNAIPDIDFNVVTELKEVIQWLKNNAPPKETPIRVGEYEGKISENGQLLVINCQKIDFAKVREIYETMKKIQEKGA